VLWRDRKQASPASRPAKIGANRHFQIPWCGGLLPLCRLLFFSSEVQGKLAVETERATGRKCPACGAEMHLIKVAPDETMMAPGYEEHTFECSGCQDHVRRLVFIPRAIGPLTSEQMRLPLASLKTENKTATAKGAWSRVLRAAPPIKPMYVFGMLIAIGLAGSAITWGQGSKGPIGDRGPPGPKGPTGDPGPPSEMSGIRIIRSKCNETTCSVQCSENEILLTAYCGPKRNLAIIPTERAAACRNPVAANDPLVAVCVQMASP
jgi:hypothetical protein